jgi:hypothetical protein
VATYNVAEMLLYFDPQSGHLVLAEMFPDADVDPCEVYFEDYRESDGRWLPQRLKVRHGDTSVADIELQPFELKAARQDET